MKRGLLVLVLLAACLPAPGWTRGKAAASIFSAEWFFTGRTEGVARLKIAMRRAVAVRIHGNGRIEPDGTLVLEQDVERVGKPLAHRAWHIRADGRGGYAGTLSDAVGPVTGRVVDGRLQLQFRGKGGLHYRQRLWLEPGGRQARNHMVVTRLGLPVAVLDETISRVDQPVP